MRIDKGFSIGNVKFVLYFEGYNLLNDQVFDYENTFSEDPENPYRQRYVEDPENIYTETEFAPYVTSVEAYLTGNQPRHYDWD